jgi:hypothetical protein
VVFNVFIDVMRQVATLIALVKNVAANDQVEPAANRNVLLLCGVFTPVPMSIVHGAEMVKAQILFQKFASQGVTV